MLLSKYFENSQVPKLQISITLLFKKIRLANQSGAKIEKILQPYKLFHYFCKNNCDGRSSADENRISERRGAETS